MLDLTHIFRKDALQQEEHLCKSWLQTTMHNKLLCLIDQLTWTERNHDSALLVMHRHRRVLGCDQQSSCSIHKLTTQKVLARMGSNFQERCIATRRTFF